MALGKPHRLKKGVFVVLWATALKIDHSLTYSETDECSSKSASVRCVYCIFTVFFTVFLGT